MRGINQNHKTYTEDDWKKAEQQNQKYSVVWYKKFKKELTFKEELKLAKYKFQYTLIKTQRTATDFFNEFGKDNYEKLKEQLQYYRDNKMDEDIEYVLKQAKEAGETAKKAVEDILKDLDIKKMTE
jgi:NACalpha-BTF3-like transcription factor